MYTGKTIDELFELVSRAEEQADAPQQRPPVRVDVHATYVYEFSYDENVQGVA
jgi:hypothetical protein